MHEDPAVAGCLRSRLQIKGRTMSRASGVLSGQAGQALGEGSHPGRQAGAWAGKWV